MKTLIFTTVLLLQGSQALACFGEAQMMATVGSMKRISTEHCQVLISRSEDIHFSENRMCPLDLREVLDQGILVKNCEFKSGAPISGIVVKDQNGLLFLE